MRVKCELAALKEIKLTPKQDAFVIAYLELQKQNKEKQWIVADLLKQIGFSKAILDVLVRKGIFCIDIKNIN